MKKKHLVAPAAVLAGSLLLAGCGASNSGGGTAAPGGSDASNAATADYAKTWGECKPGSSAKNVADIQGEDKDKDITIGAFNGWDESFATAHLLKAVLTKEGYNVTVDAYEAAPAFAGTAKGDIDVITDVWMPVTHPQYLQQFGDQLEQLGCWYDNAKLTMAVNDSSPAKSIEDLATMSDQYGGKLYGIEPGAGLTKQTKEKAIPEYGLDKMQFVVSSTPAMLAQVKKATSANENVAVTLWRPHWAYSAYPMRDLEDPKGAMGGTEVINSASSKKFAQDNPKAAQIIKNLQLNDKQLSDLENFMMSPDEFDGKDNDAAVAKWLEQNPDFAEKLKSGQLGAA
ncbi:glycine/betaine ABC transporter substrate-binding protein [Enemella evansiae]|uniref:glycine betaine ABC transporter substrate-binding protein n=1 Tax=Enemella evansiae TaxID=2016499 RepID=UPI000B969CFC|nr:glycine betaine ABC transporter substrate-binding protein [Enemella evansiae]OYN95543.1 glycine/betaine ABC transporter substrate-binding protein [Enemella evansiae]